jgi:asparagine synthase (glutamine-hydrolysing)
VRRQIGAADAEEQLSRHFARLGALPWHGQMMHFDFETYLPEDILVKVDRMSMAHSIESRVPLLDNEVVEYAARLPATVKIRNGRRKHILKEAAKGLVPSQILERRKQGFGAPIDVWFRTSPRELFADVLLSARARQRGYFEPRFVERLVHEHTAGRRDHAARLWALLVFELWHRQYLDARPDAIPQRPDVPVAVLS